MAVRVVVVGAGKMGAHHARVFAAEKDATLAGVLDVDRDAAERVARAFGGGALRTLDEAIERADLVVIATPTALHFAHARRALAAGRAVLVEKPLAATSAEARALCDDARDRGATLLVGHSERFNAVVRALALATEGETVRSIATRRTAAAPAEELCTNLAVHDIDLAAILARAPVELVSVSGSADRAEIVLRAGPAAVRAQVARGVAQRVRAIRTTTDRATYEGDLVTGRLTRDGEIVRLDTFEPLALQARAALAAVRREPSEIARGGDGLSAVAVAESAALRLGQPHDASAAE